MKWGHIIGSILGRVNPKTIQLVFSAFPSRHAHTANIKHRLTVDSGFRELAPKQQFTILI
jgi:hypothetical protein